MFCDKAAIICIVLIISFDISGKCSANMSLDICPKYLDITSAIRIVLSEKYEEQTILFIIVYYQFQKICGRSNYFSLSSFIRLNLKKKILTKKLPLKTSSWRIQIYQDWA